MNPNKIGILGYSAGAHLAASLSTKYDQIIYPQKNTVSAKNNFSVLIYPVLSMIDGVTHKGSRNKLLINRANDVRIEQFSTEKLINSTASRFSNIAFIS